MVLTPLPLQTCAVLTGAKRAMAWRAPRGRFHPIPRPRPEIKPLTALVRADTGPFTEGLAHRFHTIGGGGVCHYSPNRAAVRGVGRGHPVTPFEASPPLTHSRPRRG